jgi:hypothetical protein
MPARKHDEEEAAPKAYSFTFDARLDVYAPSGQLGNESWRWLMRKPVPALHKAMVSVHQIWTGSGIGHKRDERTIEELTWLMTSEPRKEKENGIRRK